MLWQTKEKWIARGFMAVVALVAVMGGLWAAASHESLASLVGSVFSIAVCGGILFWTHAVIRKQMAEHITAEAKARGLHTFMEMLFDNIPNMIFVKEAKNLHFTIFNKAGEELLGCSREELLGKNDFDLFPREQAEFFTAKDRQVLTDGKLLDIPEEEIKTPKGMRLLHTKKIPLFDKSGQPRYLLGISEDITDRRTVEGFARTSEALFTLGQLATRLAHQLGGPLEAIREFTVSARKPASSAQDREFALQSIDHEAERCKTLIQDLLSFCWSTKREHKPTPFNEVVKEALSLIQREAKGSSLEIHLELAADLPPIAGDSHQLQQMIINLASNAMEAMYNKGVLTLKSELKQEKSRSWVCLTVSDAGSSDTPSRMFDPFFTTNILSEKNSLGLALVHEIVRNHQGSVDIQSRPGYTEFCIKFPALTA